MIATSDDPRIQLARDLLGTVEIAPDPLLPPRVVRVVADDGQHFVAKQHTEPDRYARELHAYRTWGTHLIGHAPKLVGRDDATHTLLLTALAGNRADTAAPGSPEEELAHHEAATSSASSIGQPPCPRAAPSAPRSPNASRAGSTGPLTSASSTRPSGTC
ncbi:hypothetical protein ACFQ51_53945 [Streptomyces kaempferi]